jgi:hypothetical protein
MPPVRAYSDAKPPPPVIHKAEGAMIMRSSYIEGLKAQLVEDNKARQHSAQTQDRPPVQPLEQQVVAIMRSLPPVQALRPWSIGDIAKLCQGTWRENPHPQNLAVALRKLGWERRRIYGQQGGGQRYWLPPGMAGAA